MNQNNSDKNFKLSKEEIEDNNDISRNGINEYSNEKDTNKSSSSNEQQSSSSASGISSPASCSKVAKEKFVFYSWNKKQSLAVLPKQNCTCIVS